MQCSKVAKNMPIAGRNRKTQKFSQDRKERVTKVLSLARERERYAYPRRPTEGQQGQQGQDGRMAAGYSSFVAIQYFVRVLSSSLLLSFAYIFLLTFPSPRVGEF